MKRRTVLVSLCALCVALWCGVTWSEVKIPAVLGDNMVLQQKSLINVWGWAAPGEIIRVRAGWTKTPASVKTGSDGKWSVQLRTSKAGGPYTMSIEGTNKVLLQNIMLGEVWVCSGQSNMEFTIKMLGGWNGAYRADREDLITNKYSSLRLFTVAKDTSRIPLDTCRGRWAEANPEVVENFSATAYFFGRELSRKLGVPVGLVATSWGGTPAEAWTNLSDLRKNDTLAFYWNDPNRSGWFPTQPAVLYNAMIHPLLPFAIKGVIWYQGESNRNDAPLYHILMRTLIGNWRREWHQPDLPFYFVQIAPFNYEEPFSGALLRDAQVKTLAVPHTGMAVTMDIGDTRDIHPKNKQEVGRRLALWALADTYRMNVPAFSGPLYRSMKREENAIRLSFDHTEGGLVASGATVPGFSIAGLDRVFVDAEAKIDGNTVVVSSPSVSDPAAVRFAFTNTSESRLFNGAGLPASSFRTDDWPIVTATVSISAVYDSLQNSVVFEVLSKSPGGEVRYTLNGSDPVASSPMYTGKIRLAQSGTFIARAFKDGVGSSFIARREFVKHAAFHQSIVYVNPFDTRYTAGGNVGLVDGIAGSSNFRDGSWQGFKKNDFEATIDLNDTLEVHEIRSEFLQDQLSWIFFPRSVECSLSMDGKSFGAPAVTTNDVADSTAESMTKTFAASMHKTRARYVRVKATNIGQCPPWHPGRGGDAWLFIDEIIVK
jgi:sialate O-acetylesterase